MSHADTFLLRRMMHNRPSSISAPLVCSAFLVSRLNRITLNHADVIALKLRMITICKIAYYLEISRTLHKAVHTKKNQYGCHPETIKASPSLAISFFQPDTDLTEPWHQPFFTIKYLVVWNELNT